jgi:hypothetical protein
MWQNNGYGNNGQFQNGFNQESYPPSTFGPSSGPSLAGQHYFPNQQNLMQYEDANGEGFMNNDFQPEVGLYNEGTFMQNQFINANAQVCFAESGHTLLLCTIQKLAAVFIRNILNNLNVQNIFTDNYLSAQFSPPHSNLLPAVNPTPPRPVTQINARAAELKAELLKRREGRGNSSTPPVGTPGLATKPTVRVEGSSSLRGSPKLPVTAEKHEHELNVNDLISQYSETKPAANASVKQEKTINDPSVSTIQRPKQPDLSAKSQAPSLGSPTKVSMPASNGKQQGHNSTGKAFGGRHPSNGSVSEVSEGEIREDATPSKSIQPPTPKEAQLGPRSNKADDQPSRKSRDDQTAKQPYNRGQRDDSPPYRLPSTNPKPPNQRGRDDWREDFDPRLDQRYQPEYKNERKQYPEPEKRTYLRRDSRDEEYRRTELIAESPRDELNRQARQREQEPPTLNDLLPLDEDLREWLDITGYHNAPYRNKILNRRRAIAALDAQRDKLLAEMEAEERGGVPAAIGSQTPASSMLPPPIPNKVAGGRVEPPLTSAGNSMVDTQRDRVVSNKRPYSDVQDPRDEAVGGKVARIEDRPYGPRVKEEDGLDYRRSRIKEEEDVDYRRPRSTGYESARRSSIDRRDERYDVRGRSRERERERELSPGRRAYESRPTARTRPYESDTSHYRDEISPSRPYEVRGAYRGRAFDPNYRGRGRGRAREFPYVRDPRDMDPKPEAGFGSRIANGRPFRDPKPFDKGSRGGP